MDIQKLALQLRKPEGKEAEDVGHAMASFNADANAWMVSLMDIQPTDAVLEIGFGPGETLRALSMLTPDGFVAGIDYSEAMVEMASKKNADALGAETMQLHCCDATSIPYADGHFTKACAANVIYFWQEPQVPLQEIRRVLAPGGLISLYMTDPKNWLPGIAETGVFAPYTPEDVRGYLESGGFRDVQVHRTTIPEGDAYCITARK